MTGTLFRPEALEFHEKGRETEGGVVRLGRPWLTWLSVLTLAVAAAGAVCLFAVRVTETTSGPALVDRSGSVTVLVPAAVAPELAGSEGLTVALPGHEPVRVDVTAARPVDDAAVRRAGLQPLDQPGLLLAGRLARGAAVGEPAELRTTGTIVLRRERLGQVLSRQFSAMLGNRQVQS